MWSFNKIMSTYRLLHMPINTIIKKKYGKYYHNSIIAIYKKKKKIKIKRALN